MTIELQGIQLDRLGASQIVPVLLSGGSGTRLWPVSRVLLPKQLLRLTSERTMLQETLLRTAHPGFAAPLIICNAEHRFLIAEQLAAIEVPPRQIVLEPMGRNTASALAVAALIIAKSDPKAIMLAQPSDHRISDVDAFRSAVLRARPAADAGRLVAFGITPNYVETGYGYIARGEPLVGSDGVYAVDRFIEKPSRDVAETLLKQGFLWNSGIFLLPVTPFLTELRTFEPELIAACAAAVGDGTQDAAFFRLHDAAFGRAPSISVDRAVMERTSAAAVMPVDIEWSDIGSWRSLHGNLPQDGDGNVFDGDVLVDGVRNSYIRSRGHLVAAIGLDGMIVVSTDDATLIAPAERAGDVESIVKRLRQSNRVEPVHHRRVYRPWGFYQTVDVGDQFQVKRIMVRPGGQLSLQMHYHRSEHWVVVAGTAKVTRDDQTMILRENESFYIPIGARHRLENPGRLPLNLVEVQCGPYLGEDDIVRFNDVYGRA